MSHRIACGFLFVVASVLVHPPVLFVSYAQETVAGPLKVTGALPASLALTVEDLKQTPWKKFSVVNPDDKKPRSTKAWVWKTC